MQISAYRYQLESYYGSHLAIGLYASFKHFLN